MGLTRRGFLKSLGVIGAGATGTACQQALASSPTPRPEKTVGVLVDIPNCIGCRKCEYACQEAAAFNPPALDTFEDKSVFKEFRRPDNRSYTVINEFADAPEASQPVWVKYNCMHCLDPACVSACIVGALTVDHSGAVSFDAHKCIGCRYCMIACPFQIPTYEYDNAFTPEVRKCTFCVDALEDGGVPACVNICPRECLTFGDRSMLLELARSKIGDEPDGYIDHIYGEHEVGGTNWMYISKVPFEKLGLPKLGTKAPPRLTEAIQHGVFKLFMPPLALYGVLGMIMRFFRRKEPNTTLPPVGPIQRFDLEGASAPAHTHETRELEGVVK